MEELPVYLKAQEVAEMLGKPENHIRRLAIINKIPGIRIEKIWRFDREKILRFIDIKHTAAIHEAGHAVMSVICEMDLIFVTVVPRKDTLGRCINKIPYTENETIKSKLMENSALVLLAGVTAEYILLNIDPMTNKRKEDLDKAREIFNSSNDGSGKERSDNATKIVWDTFMNPLVQKQTKAIAEALMKYNTLKGIQVREIIKACGTE